MLNHTVHMGKRKHKWCESTTQSILILLYKDLTVIYLRLVICHDYSLPRKSLHETVQYHNRDTAAFDGHNFR